MGKHKKKKPEIRFKGFTDDWEQCKLGEMATFSKGIGYSKSDLQDSGKPIILYGRLYTKYETVISNVDTFAIEKPNSVISKGKEVIVPASGEIAEDIAVASVVGEAGVLLGGDLNIIVALNNLNSEFLAITISNGKPHTDITKMAQGKSVVHIHNSDLEKINILYPDYTEQCKLSMYFSNIDHLITLHQRKLNNLKKVKKSMLEKMFPQNGEMEPQIRFCGFNSTWEQRKLRDVSDVRDGTHDSPVYQSSGHPFVTSKNVKNGFINYDDIQYISDEDFENINKRSKVDVNDILMGMIGTIGNMALIRTEPDFAIKNVALIKYTNQIDCLFLYHFLHSHNVENQLFTGMDGGTQKFVSLDKIRNLNILIPSKIEQDKIGMYCSNLDNLITLHQRKLEKLKKIKKAMLEKMFV